VALLKNTASQKIAVKALDAAGEAVLDNETFITCKVAIDHGTATALTDTNPTETEDGVYLFDVTQAETNGNHLLFYPESSTADVVVIVLDGANGHTIDYSLYKADVSALATSTALGTLTTTVGAAGAGLSAIPWNTSWDAEVQSECEEALNAYDPPTRAEATADKDAVLAVVATAQTDLDLITGTDGVTLATAQANYQPVKVGVVYDVTTVNGTLATEFVST
jgi:hypothetical protein